MSSLNRTDANRRNAQKSTGPRTAAGKAASSQNALKSGIDAQSLIIRGEDPDDLAMLIAQYHLRFQPQNPEENVLVDALITADWLLRRLRKVEPQLWEKEFKDAKIWSRYEPDVLLGDAFERGRNAFNRLQRRLDSMERSYHRALNSLRTLRPDCFGTPIADQADPAPTDEIGFVPQAPLSPESHPGPIRETRSASPIGFVPQARPSLLPTPPPREFGFVAYTHASQSAPPPPPWDNQLKPCAASGPLF